MATFFTTHTFCLLIFDHCFRQSFWQVVGEQISRLVLRYWVKVLLSMGQTVRAEIAFDVQGALLLLHLTACHCLKSESPFTFLLICASHPHKHSLMRFRMDKSKGKTRPFSLYILTKMQLDILLGNLELPSIAGYPPFVDQSFRTFNPR